MLGKKILHFSIKYQAVLPVPKTVPLIREKDILHLFAGLPHGSYNLGRLLLWNSGIVGALGNQQGPPNSVYMEKRVFDPPKEFIENAHIKSMEAYKELYRWSIEEPEAFWAEMGEKNLDWFKKWDGPVGE